MNRRFNVRELAICPGTFDPITYGHLNIVERGMPLFDKIIIAVAKEAIGKDSLFSINERVEMIKESVKQYPKAQVEEFSGLLVDYAKTVKSKVILRGLRALSDFEHEFQMASMNKRLNPEIETFFIMTDEEYFFVSSSAVKEIARFGGSLSQFVPSVVEKKLREKFGMH